MHVGDNKSKMTLSAYFFGALIFGFDTIILALTYAALIYSGFLDNYYALGVCLILIGSIVTILIESLFSPLPTIISQPQDEPLPIFVIMTASIASVIQAHHAESSMLPTVICAIALATVFTGIIFYILGTFRAGNLVFFLPYPVLGGFLAGVGWLLFIGAIKMLTGIPTHYENIYLFFEPMNLLRWGLGLFYGVFLYILIKRSYNIFIVVFTAVLFVLLSHVVPALFHIPFSSLQEYGFMINIDLTKSPFTAIHELDFSLINWQIIFSEIGNILIITLFSIIAILTKETSLDITLKEEIDVNRVLQVSGIANILTGLTGGIVGYITVNNTTLNTRFQQDRNSRSRIIGILTAICCLAGLNHYGLSAVSYLPRMIPGGLIMFFAISFLKEWLIDNKSKMPIRDYMIIWIILFVVILYGILPGIIVGIFFAMIFFIISYMDINIMKNILTEKELHSNKQRQPEIQDWLTKHGSSILYIKLQDYLFFGNANSVYQEIKHRLQISEEPIKFVILDFSLLAGLDSSALLSFLKIKIMAAKENFILIFTQVKPKTLKLLLNSHLFALPNEPANELRFIPNYEDALEWCEDQLISMNHLTLKESISLEERLMHIAKNEDCVKSIDEYFEKFMLKSGGVLFSQGEPSGPLYYIESGYLIVQLEIEPNNFKVLRKLGPGNVIGEMGLYLSQERSATVIAGTDCLLEKLSYEDMIRMYHSNLDLAIAFQQLIIEIIVERVVYANNQLKILF